VTASPRGVAAVLAVTLALSTVPAGAFVRTMTCTSSGSFACEPGESPKPIEWAGACVRWHLNEDGYSKLNFDRIEAATKAGFEVWNEPACGGFAFAFGGLTNDTSVGYQQGGNNANIVTFRETSWAHQSGILALTSVTYAPSDGEIVDADMELNGEDYTFTVAATGGSIDLQNTVAHEAGHVLGLDHSAVQTATMFATAPEGEISKRELDGDDVLGLCEAYPEGVRQSCSGGSDGFFDAGAPAPSPASSGSGCSAVAPSGGGLLPVFVVLLGLLAFAGRRRTPTVTAGLRRTPAAAAVAVVVVATVFALAPAPAEAFVRTLTCTSAGANACDPGEQARPIFWPAGCVTYHIQEAGPEDTSNERAFALIEDGFAAWNAPDCSFLTLINGGFTNEDRVGYNPYTGPEGNANVLLFRDKNWEHGAGIVALTSVTYSPSSGEIADSDIEYNGADYRLTTTNDPLRVLIDIGNTTTHEAGHFLGLDHTPVADATMFPTAPSGETDKRTLEQDDIDGVCACYPKSQDTGSTTCLGADLGFFSRPELGPDDGRPPAEAIGPCSCDVHRRAGWSGVSVLVLAMGVLGTTGLRRIQG
jgi:hypothetical protein